MAIPVALCLEEVPPRKHLETRFGLNEGGQGRVGMEERQTGRCGRENWVSRDKNDP